MATSSSKSCGDVFSDDLINEFLLRLPVKSLLRFKAVSKRWCSLISSPKFVESHLKITSLRDNDTLIVHHKDNVDNKTSLISLFNLSCRRLVADLEGPFEFADCEIVGSDGGIVCVSACTAPAPSRRMSAYSYTTNLYLWNPATRQSRLIHERSMHHEHIVSYAFGFDPINNDYKVVWSLGFPFVTAMYSTNTDAWRRVRIEQTKNLFVDQNYVCVNGFLCWTDQLGSYDIVAFDLSKEVYNCAIKFPVRAKSCNASVTRMNDSIGVIIWEEGFKGKINLWKLDDVECLRDGGGVEASWTRILGINVDMPVMFVHSYFSSGDLLLQSDDRTWFSYNSYEKQAKMVPDSEQWRQIYKYTESLVECSQR